MLQNVVLVRAGGPDPKKLKIKNHSVSIHDSGTSYLGCSGVVVCPSCLPTTTEPTKDCKKYIMCNGCAIAPFLRPPAEATERFELVKDAEIHVMFESDLLEQTHVTSWHKCRVVYVGQVENADDGVRVLTGGSSSFTVGWYPESYNTQYNNGMRFSLGLTALLEVEQCSSIDCLNMNKCTLASPCISWASNERTKRGDKVYCVGSPYGLMSPSVMRSSVSHGIVSNKAGAVKNLKSSSERPSLLVTDARCLPGAEGGGVFNKDGQFIGMIGLPLRHSDGYPVELSFVLTSDVLLPWIVENISNELNETHNSEEFRSQDSTKIDESQGSDASVVDIAQKSLVAISVGTSWSSGIILTENGHIVTNQHLFRSYLSKSDSNASHSSKGDVSHSYKHPVVRISSRVRLMPQHFIDASRHEYAASAKWHKAEVLYLSTGPWDIALLKIDPPSPLNAAIIMAEEPKKGQEVFALGHPLFNPKPRLQATLTSGALSQVVKLKNRIILLQSSAVIHRGNSGGMLVDSNGRLLGMVTSNVRFQDTSLEDKYYPEGQKPETPSPNKSVIPTLNFSIPVSIIQQLFQYIKTGDVSILKQLDTDESEILEYWNMQKGQTEDPGPKYPSFFANLKKIQDEDPDGLTLKTLQAKLKQKNATKGSTCSKL